MYLEKSVQNIINQKTVNYNNLSILTKCSIYGHSADVFFLLIPHFFNDAKLNTSKEIGKTIKYRKVKRIDTCTR